MTGRQNTPNLFQIRKESPIVRTVDHIDEALNRFAEVQLTCAGTAIEKMILIAERCVKQGVAEYSRFTSGLISHQNREVIYTLAKLRRPTKALKNENKPNKEKQQVVNKPVNKPKNYLPKSKQYQDSYQKSQNRQQNPNKKQTYNEDHRERNERRERENYRQKNERNDRGQRNNEGKRGNDNERNKEREYR